jgi:cellulose synthase/poly-beta-1,6-N-acetylglucosamine synthase-like glycosyltransferase
MDFREFKEKYQKKEVEEISFSPPVEPVVSVLVQTYQQKDFIKECLDSILMQETTFEYEILVGDDGSTDGTREICQQYAENYPGKIRLFLHHRENQIQVLGEATFQFQCLL